MQVAALPLQDELKQLIGQFLQGVKLDESFLVQSQLDLNSILEKCVAKCQAINGSVQLSQIKCEIIQQKLGKIPKLQTRIQTLSKLCYEAHKRIDGINKNVAQFEKIQMLEKQHLEAQRNSNTDKDSPKKESKITETSAQLEKIPNKQNDQ